MLDLGAEVRPFGGPSEQGECFMYTWKTDETGLIVVTREDGSEFVPTLTGKWADIMSSVIARWGDTVRPITEQFGVLDRWVLAMIYQESNGNPRAFRQERHADGSPIISQPSGRPLTGVGLLQITSEGLKGGHTDEQLFDPVLNLTIGTRYIRDIARRPDVNWDWPKVAATFNGGSPRPNPKSEWNLYCYGNHVDAEVSAQNYCILRGMSDAEKEASRAAALQFDLTAGAFDDAHAGELADLDEPDTRNDLKPV